MAACQPTASPCKAADASNLHLTALGTTIPALNCPMPFLAGRSGTGRRRHSSPVAMGAQPRRHWTGLLVLLRIFSTPGVETGGQRGSHRRSPCSLLAPRKMPHMPRRRRRPPPQSRQKVERRAGVEVPRTLSEWLETRYGWGGGGV